MPVSMAGPWGSFMNSSSSVRPKKKYRMTMGTQMSHTRLRPAPKPALTRSILPAPMFWEV